MKVQRHGKKDIKHRGRPAMRWLLIVAAIFLLIAVYFFVSLYIQRRGTSLLITFFDVSAGDAVLIQTPSGKKILIDGGPDATILRKIGNILPFYDRTLDLVTVSHEDTSALGGLVDVADSYHIGEVLEPEGTSSTTASAIFEKSLADKKIPRLVAVNDGSILLDKGIILKILFSSDGEMIARISYGDTSFVFTGNATQKMEKKVAAQKSDLLLGGHNGSKASSAPAFISAVSPKYAVISAAVGNRYNYPSQITLDTLERTHATVFQTGKTGTITFALDGKTVLKK